MAKLLIGKEKINSKVTNNVCRYYVSSLYRRIGRGRRIAITLPGADVAVQSCWYRTALYLQHTVFSEV